MFFTVVHSHVNDWMLVNHSWASFQSNQIRLSDLGPKNLPCEQTCPIESHSGSFKSGKAQRDAPANLVVPNVSLYFLANS